MNTSTENSVTIDRSKIIARAIEIATAAHKGQKRTDGKDYITHPIAVYELIKSGTLSYEGKNLVSIESYFNEEEKLILEVAALLHDVFEDNKQYKLELDVLASLFEGLELPEDFLNELFDTLELVTRTDDESYVEFIVTMSYHDFACAVKTADLIHNLSDLKDGARKDKYELALYIINPD